MAGIWTRLTGAIVGIGVGEAGAAAIEPVLEPQRQKAWQESRARIFELDTLAQLVAQGLVDRDAVVDEAERNGYDPSRLDAAIQLALVAAPVSELLELWRRGKITEPLVDHGLAKAQIEPQYWPALKELYNARIEPPTVAVAVQRGVMANAHDPASGQPLLPVGPTSERGVVTPMPVSPLDPLVEAQASGYDFDRLAVLARNAGLSPGPGQLLELLNRGAIELPDFYRGISEGDLRNEWAQVMLALRRRLISPHDYAELNLRGWITPAQRDAGAALSGMTAADADLLFKLLGRPLATHQVTTGLARGGQFGGDYAGVPEPYLTALRQSNVRPEWGNLDYANRYSYPSAFFFRLLLTSGAITQAEGEQAFLELGWAPKWAQLIAQTLAPSGAKVSDPHVAKAETQLWTALHKSYVAGKTPDGLARQTLVEAGVSAAGVDQVLLLWQAERGLVRRELTAAQIKKAVDEPYATRAEKVAALVELGYNDTDANAFLDQ